MSAQTRRRLSRLEVVLGIALVGLLAVRFAPEALPRMGVATRAPDVAIPTFEGDTIRLGELRGSVVLVNFWATWCAPCQVEMPEIQRVWEAAGDRGLVVLGLSTDTDPIADFVHALRRGGITYPLALADGPTQRRLGHGGTLPMTLLIDRSGHVRHRREGALDLATLRALIEPLLQE